MDFFDEDNNNYYLYNKNKIEGIRILFKIGNKKSDYENSIVILKLLEDFNKNNTPATITQLQSRNEILSEISNQKMASIIKHYLIDKEWFLSVNDRNKEYYCLDKELLGNDFFDLLEKTGRNYQKEQEEIEKILDNHNPNIDKLFDESISNIEDKDYDASKILNNKEELLKYLKIVSDIHGDIYSLKQRYLKLIFKRNKLAEDALPELVDNIMDLNDKCNNILKEIDSFIALKSDYEMIVNENTYLSQIKEPVFSIKEPIAPIYKKSSIFNSKKINDENNELKEKYERDLKDYNDALKEFKTQYEKYKLSLELQKKEIERKKDLIVNNNINSIDDIDKVINKKKEENQKVKELKMQLVNENNKYQSIKAIDYELEFIIDNVKQNIELLNNIYSYNIIYGKYRNFIAISSFIDYFMSGRCTKLDGIDGAYNLYESESRSDIISNKLDKIITSLDEIKNNQYYICNKLEVINKTLNNINSQLLVNNVFQVLEISQLQKLINNTDEMSKNISNIAYNTDVMTYYSKKTSNYTKALAYMKFLNG